VFGAEPAELSLLHFLFYLRSGGGFRNLVEIENAAQQTRFHDGAASIAIRMAERLEAAVELQQPVRSIAQTADGVTVTTDAAVFEAKRVIVAVPPALAARIRYEPGLPAHRDQLLQHYPMGSTTKVFAVYDRAFWREDGMSGEVVCCDGPLSVVFDNSSGDGTTPCLLAFICGRDARAWSPLPEAERRDVVLRALSRYFGARALSPAEYFEKNWDAEAYTRGCPVGYAGAGALTGYGAALRDPIGRIHWAGTETATVWNGYMDGALQSGERAAREAIAAL
jgi:monoamine oxidase